MKTLIILLLIPLFALAEDSQFEHLSTLIHKNNIIGRDSGEAVTKSFLSACLKPQSERFIKIECSDVLFTYNISTFTDSTNSQIILITEDGASVENRYVISDKGENITAKVWPSIPLNELSELLIKHTGQNRYAAKYIRQVAHSSYRIIHLGAGKLNLVSGIPDDWFGTKLGEIKWNGNKFIFKKVKFCSYSITTNFSGKKNNIT